MLNHSPHALTQLPVQTIIACALACEAKPLIDYFKLKKQTGSHAFSLYQSGSVFLIVSGIGQHNMSAAINWLNGYLNTRHKQFWLNTGVAGHPSAPIGTLFCVHKISAQQTTLYPTKWLKHKITLAPLITAEKEETHYQQTALYDMEGFAFYQAATRFNSQECVQCLKIVSDNKQHAAQKDKAFISQLIAQQCTHIIDFIARHTNTLAQHIHPSPLWQTFQQQLIKRIHFSHSQQLQLANLCLSAHSHNIDLNTLDLTQHTQAQSVLTLLKQQLDRYAVSL